jgi:hypothetical protein
MGASRGSPYTAAVDERVDAGFQASIEQHQTVADVVLELTLARQQPIDVDPKFLFESKKNVRRRSNQSSFIFRKLTLADSEPICELVLAQVESPNLP